MKHSKTTIKYCAFNSILKESYLCTSKKLLAKRINTSVDTIRRREVCSSVFVINEWYIYTNVKVHKQPIRNVNKIGLNNPL